MYLPKLDNIQSSRESATEFRGYNHTYRVSGKEFYDMKNMSGRNYPALSPRVQRGIQHESLLYGIHTHEKFYVLQDATAVWTGPEGSGQMRAVFMFYGGYFNGKPREELAGGHETSGKPKMPLSKTKKRLLIWGRRYSFGLIK